MITAILSPGRASSGNNTAVSPVFKESPASNPNASNAVQSGTAAQVAAFQAKGIPQGLKAYNPADPFASFYPIVVTRNTPLKAPAGFPVSAEACMRARGLIYWKSTPGDCGTNKPLSDSDLQDLTIARSSASLATSTLGVAGVLAGPATLGISIGVAVIATAVQAIFTHHAQAVTTEQSTLCQVAQLWNQVMAQVDSQVYDGTIDPSDAATIISNLGSELTGNLEAIMKTCDAACVYQGIINCHVDFAKTYYPWLAPNGDVAGNPSNPAIGASRPGSPLSSPISSTPVAVVANPGNVPQTNVGISNSQAQPTGGSQVPTFNDTSYSNVNPALTTSFGGITSTTWVWVGLAAIVGTIIYLIVRK
jgi:hypothetical protein